MWLAEIGVTVGMWLAEVGVTAGMWLIWSQWVYYVSLYNC